MDCRADLGHHLGQGLLGHRMRGVLQAHHLASAIMVTYDPGETHHRSGGAMGHQLLVFGQRMG